jgi:PAS domain S-box-containing protein
VDCLVSDYDMPGTDGIELLETVRAAYPDLPFVLFTGKGSEEIASRAISAGVTDYIQKTSDPNQYTLLANRIRNAVGQARAEAAVESTRERYSRLLERSADYIFIVAPDGTVDYVTPSVEHVLGYSPTELDGEDALAYVHPDDAEDAADAFTALLEDPDEEMTTEFRSRHADGSWCWLEVRGRNLLSDPVIEGVVLNVREVTERTERERRLRRQKAKIAALHDVATDLEGCETREAVFERVVEAAESILAFDIAIADGVEGDHLVPRAVSSTISAEQYYEETLIDAEDNLAAEAYRTGEPSVVDDLHERGVAPADSAFRSSLTVPLGDHGVFQTVAETPGAFDADDLELVELLAAHARACLSRIDNERQLHDRQAELRRQNERLDAFASVVSHDLRNPLAVADGNLELAREECDSDHLDEVGHALDRMDELVEDLLALSRDGERVEDVERVDLAAFVERCWRNVATDDATLAVAGDREMLADEGRLKRLVENLMRNAVEHGTTDATGAVTVTVGALDDGFYVADDGPGIPEGEREAVFDVGYTTTEDGTGFGLGIVEQIAAAHDWTVEITESDAGGTRFEISGVDDGER